MKNEEEFEKIVYENDKLIHYHIRSLQIIDSAGEFFAEGLFALWEAYLTYNPELGKFSTYLSWKIRNRLIDEIRKRAKSFANETSYIEKEIHALSYITEDKIADTYFWNQVKKELTENQWKWVYYFIVHDLSIEQIAKLENVTRDAVKNWGRHAKKKLSQLEFLRRFEESAV